MKKVKKTITGISNKKLAANAVYRPIRDSFLKMHPVCQVHDCTRPTTNLHHVMGREHNIFADEWARINDIPLLYDVRFFLASCDQCHPKRIHENPEWARSEGYILSLDQWRNGPFFNAPPEDHLSELYSGHLELTSL